MLWKTTLAHTLQWRSRVRQRHVIPRLLGCTGQASDAVSAYTQVKMEDAPTLLKLPKSECPDIWISLPRYKWPKKMAKHWRTSGAFGKEVVRTSFCRIAKRKTVRESSSGNCEKAPTWECLCAHRQQGFFYQYKWTTSKWEERSGIWSHGRIYIDEQGWSREANCISWSSVPWIYSTRMHTERTSRWRVQKNVRVTKSCKQHTPVTAHLHATFSVNSTPTTVAQHTHIFLACTLAQGAALMLSTLACPKGVSSSFAPCSHLCRRLHIHFHQTYHTFYNILHSQKIREGFTAKGMGRKQQPGNVCSFIDSKDCSYPCTWMTSKWQGRKRIWSRCDTLFMKKVDSEKPTTFLDQENLGCTQRECKSSAYTRSNTVNTSEVWASRHLDTSIAVHMAKKDGRTLKNQWCPWKGICADIFFAGLQRERQFEKVLLENGWAKAPTWECLCVHRQQRQCLSVYVDDIKMWGKKRNLEPRCKMLMNKVDLEKPFAFLDQENLGCTQRECTPNDRLVDENRKMFEWRNSAGATENMPDSGKGHWQVIAWSYDIVGHAQMRWTVLRVGKHKHRAVV